MNTVPSIERVFGHSPFSTVTVVARIKGAVTEGMVREAVARVRARHANLRVVLETDSEHNLWFTSEGAQEIEVEAVP